jgi:LysM repeat protein
VKTGYTNSSAASALYTISTTLPAPAFSVAAGTYSSAQTVSITDATAGAIIYYTTNGATPTTSSSVYSGPISVSATETLKAIAAETGYTTSAASSAAYTIHPSLPAPAFSVAAGSYAASQSVAISDATSGTTIYYTTNGTAPTTSSTVYSGPITVSATETLEAIAVETGYTTSSHLLGGGGNLHRTAVGDTQRCNVIGSHLLHHQRHHAHDGLDDVRWSALDQRKYDDYRHCSEVRICQQPCGHGNVQDRPGPGHANVLAGRWD